jgi:hypothetical protein
MALLDRLWAEGPSCTEIARRMGLNKGAVAGKVYRLGLPQRGAVCGSEPKPVSESQRSIIRNHWHRGRLKDMETYTGLDHRRIKKIAAEMGLPTRSRAVVARPAARSSRELPVSGARAASPSRPRAAIISGVSSAVERLGASPQVENLPEAVGERQPPRVFSQKQCQYITSSADRAHRFCEAPVVENAKGRPSAYCAAHFELCLIPAKKYEAERKARLSVEGKDKPYHVAEKTVDWRHLYWPTGVWS